MIRVGKPSTPRSPAPGRSIGSWVWSVVRLLRSRGWLGPRRIGCLLVVLVIATVWLGSQVLSGINSWFSNRPPAVAGSPFDTVAPSHPASSGSETIERILRRGRLIVAIRESPGLLQRSSDSGGYTGFEVALLDVIARDLGVDPARTSYKPLPAGGRLGALRRGEVDLTLGPQDDSAVQDPDEVGVAGPYLIRGNTEYVIGLPPGDAVLRDRITASLRHAIDDGTWASLYRQYLGDSPPAPPAPR